MQRKTTLISPLPAERVTVIKKPTNNRSWQVGEKKEPFSVFAGLQIDTANMEINMAIQQNLKLEVPPEPAVSLEVSSQES